MSSSPVSGPKPAIMPSNMDTGRMHHIAGLDTVSDAFPAVPADEKPNENRHPSVRNTAPMQPSGDGDRTSVEVEPTIPDVPMPRHLSTIRPNSPARTSSPGVAREEPFSRFEIVAVDLPDTGFEPQWQDLGYFNTPSFQPTVDADDIKPLVNWAAVAGVGAALIYVADRIATVGGGFAASCVSFLTPRSVWESFTAPRTPDMS